MHWAVVYARKRVREKKNERHGKAGLGWCMRRFTERIWDFLDMGRHMPCVRGRAEPSLLMAMRTTIADGRESR